MTRKLFSEGGPHRVKSLSNDQYSMSITIPTDEDGRMARECPNADCSPGYFKVKPGTGVTGGQTVAYCPYCRRTAEPNDFLTKEQVRYAKDIAVQETQKGVQGVIEDALGLGPSRTRKFGGGFISMELTYKPGTLAHVWRPFEDEVRRDVVCPHCTLDHTVFGLATWCADCGRDIFMTHVAAELSVTRMMLGDVTRRQELLGKRVAAKDLENCLEDVVSIFEASLKALVRRTLADRGDTSEQIDASFKKIGNSFQSIRRTREQLDGLFGFDLTVDVKWGTLSEAFEKRHPVTHNLGVIDRKYLERVQAAEHEGREVRISASEIDGLLFEVHNAIEAVYKGIAHNAHSSDAHRSTDR